MSTSPETMANDWKKVTDPEIAEKATDKLQKEGAKVEGVIYTIPSYEISDERASKLIKQILSQIQSIDTFDFSKSKLIDQFIGAIVGLAEEATVKRYGIEHFVVEKFTGTDKLSFYCTREDLEASGFTFDDEKGIATPPEPFMG